MKMKLAQKLVMTYYKTRLRTLGMVSPRKAAELAYKIFSTPRNPSATPKEPPVFHKSEKLQLNFNGIVLQGFRWIPTQSNRHKILIVHGFSSYSYKFEKYVSLLKKQGFEVVAFDAPAHGLSGGKRINSLLYRDAILAIEQAFGPFYGMMGHSLGGLSATLAFKQLTNQLARRLVIIAPATETWRSIDHFLGLFSADEKLKQAFLEMLTELTHETIESISVSDAVKYIQSPIFWVHDKQDKICVFEDVQTMIDKKIPNIKFHVTQGLGHSFVYKEAQVSNEIVQFFKEGIN